MKDIFLVSILLLFSGCATIINETHELVTFSGGASRGETKISSPFGIYRLDNGRGVHSVPRSRRDIPITITCNNSKYTGIMPTSANIFFIGGNLIFGGIPGWIIDGFGNKGYDYDQPVDLSRYCSNSHEQSESELTQSQIIVKKISKSRKKVLVSGASGLESGETLSFNDKFGKACLAQVSRLLKKKKLAVLDVSSCRNRRLIKRGSVFQKNDEDEELDF